jgi:hypothetical protein
MVASLQNVVNEIEIGKPLSHGRLTLMPLIWSDRSRRHLGFEYLTLDEAVRAKHARVVEVTEQGSVPHMTVVNDCKVPLFVPDGMTLIGGKQNRVVNMSLLLASQSTTIIAVSCIEQGRWHANAKDSTPSAHCDPELRKKMCSQTVECQKSHRAMHVDQGTVWGHVGEVLAATRSGNPTGSYARAYINTEDKIKEGLKALPCPEDATGVAILVDGQVRSVDLFDRPLTLQKLWSQIVPGALMASLGATSAQCQSEDIRAVLSDSLNRPVGEAPAIGMGKHCRFEGSHSVGSVLLHNDQLVHLSVFAQSPRGQSNAGSTPSAPRASQAVVQRPWWRRFRSS